MAISFNHGGIIRSLDDNFVRYFKKYSSLDVAWEFPDKEGHALISGFGNDEVLIYETTFRVSTKEIPVIFKEDSEGTMTVEVAKKDVAFLKRNEGMNGMDGKFLKIIAESLKEAI